MKFTRIALFGAATVAAAQPHNHVHRHPVRQGSPVEGRDAAVTAIAPGPVVTVFELNGKPISGDEVQEGLKNGKYILIGDKIAPAPAKPTVAPPAPSVAAPSIQAAQFAEKKPTTTAAPAPTYVAPAPVKVEAPKESPKESPKSSPSSDSSGSGDVNAEFPSGTIPCSTFPSAYGAVNLDWLKLGGWSGIQETPNFNFGVDNAISYIATAIAGGKGCTAGSFCSYACPPGYQKSQWPEAQGNTGQSIGGLYCNAQGKLELSRPSVKTICTKGAGGISVKNKLSKNVAICRTDYPGTESETVPLNTEPGATSEMCNVDSASYFQWKGMDTTAQYYVNPSGASLADACHWGVDGSNMGNFSPLNIGVGKSAKDGITYISIFQNAPTNTNGKLDFDIVITGDVSGKCEYKSGKYYTDGKETPSGCTTGVKSGGKAVFELS